MKSKVLLYLNKLDRAGYTVGQIAEMCWYWYHVIWKIIKTQEISPRQEWKCLYNLIRNAEEVLSERELLWLKYPKENDNKSQKEDN